MSLFTSNSRSHISIVIDFIIGLAIVAATIATVKLLSTGIVAPQFEWVQVSLVGQDSMSDPEREEIQVYGGSSANFGFNYPYFDEMTDKKVLDFGLHAGLGLDSLIRRVKANAQDGDIVIMQLEGAYFERLEPTHLEQEIGLSFVHQQYGLFNFASIKAFMQTPFDKIWEVLKRRYDGTGIRPSDKRVCGSEKDLQKRLTKPRFYPAVENVGEYCELSFNILGFAEAQGRARTLTLEPKIRTKLDSLQRTLTRRGATMYFMPAPAIDRSDALTERAVEQREAFFQEMETKGFKSICAAGQVFPVSMFGDTYLHLNHVGSFIRAKDTAQCFAQNGLTGLTELDELEFVSDFLRDRQVLEERYQWEQIIIDFADIKTTLVNRQAQSGSFPPTDNRWVSLADGRIGSGAEPALAGLAGLPTRAGNARGRAQYQYRSDGQTYALRVSEIEHIDLALRILPSLGAACEPDTCQTLTLQSGD